ncbi:hypothetical protein HOG98_08515 [bacterium]|jgi:collagenase-like PrtC family protease|nr:hypothetical protein [bacterium]
MQLSVACNWDPVLIENMNKLGVVDLYGRVKNDPYGGGRVEDDLSNFDYGKAKEYISEVKSRDMKFTYLFNTMTLSNDEFSDSGKKKIINYLEEIANLNVTTIAVTLPYLGELIKKYVPHIKINVSILANVTSGTQAKYWDDLGAYSICLAYDVTRDFKALKAIRKAVKCRLGLLVNDPCLYRCPDLFHHNMERSLSNKTCGSNSKKNYFYLRCSCSAMNNPTEFVRSMFVRPEDTSSYEEIGIDYFKIAERLKSTRWLTNATKAYYDRAYEGNLADILTMYSQFDYQKKDAKPLTSDSLKNPEWMNEEFKDGNFLGFPYIDNQKLSEIEFLEFFKKHDCKNSTCDKVCKYCEKSAKEVVSFDNDRKKIVADNLDLALDNSL